MSVITHKRDLIKSLNQRKTNIDKELTLIRTIMDIEERTLFDQDPPIKTGEELRNEGMKQATDHANMRYRPWSEEAYTFLLKFLQSHNEFMVEDVRKASEGIVSTPPSLRAWGSIVVRAAKEGHIQRIGYASVSNAKAHRTPATVWLKT